MQRVLIFGVGKDEERRYVMLQQAFLQGGLLMATKSKSTDIYRREIRILDAIDALGCIDPDAPIPGLAEGKQLVHGGGKIVLTTAEYDLLKSYVLAMPWGPQAARAVVDLHEWLENADTQEGP